MTGHDRIEQSIDIQASAQRVWDLVSEPGWYINDREIRPHRIDRDGDLAIVHDPVHGRFAIRTVTLDPPRYAAFRWHVSPDDPDGPSTLVEFTIEPSSGTGVTLTVVETGFASLPGDEVSRRKHFDENHEGWIQELEVARKVLEAPDAGAGH